MGIEQVLNISKNNEVIEEEKMEEEEKVEKIEDKIEEVKDEEGRVEEEKKIINIKNDKASPIFEETVLDLSKSVMVNDEDTSGQSKGPILFFLGRYSKKRAGGLSNYLFFYPSNLVVFLEYPLDKKIFFVSFR